MIDSKLIDIKEVTDREKAEPVLSLLLVYCVRENLRTRNNCELERSISTHSCYPKLELIFWLQTCFCQTLRRSLW